MAVWVSVLATLSFEVLCQGNMVCKPGNSMDVRMLSLEEEVAHLFSDHGDVNRIAAS